MPAQPGAKSLIENWSFEGTGLVADDVSPLLAHQQPQSIVYFENGEAKQINPAHYESGELQSDKILYLSDAESIESTRREREARALLSPALTPAPDADADVGRLEPLSANSYEIVSFAAGRRADGRTLVPVAPDLLGALQGPDYSFESFDASDDAKMREHLSTVLPLGNGGLLVLRAKEGGFLSDGQGFDFAVFQTTFRIMGTNKFWQKFASLGVSDSNDPAAVKWFSCDPRHGVLRGCVGVVPTSEGGDRFGLAELDVKRARYIWIRDIGSNFNYTSRWPTEGCAVDALRFDHAYRKD